MKESSALHVLVCCLMLSLLGMFVAACAPRSAPTPTPSSVPPSITSLPAPVTPAASSTATSSTVTLLTRAPDPSLTHPSQPPTATLTATITSSPATPFYLAHISGGSLHTCLVTEPGGVLCWGANDFGQLGTDAEFNYDAFGKPYEVMGLPERVEAITAGAYHSCALTQTGSALCWGQNRLGQLGDGTLTDSNRPVEVSGLSGGITQISAGYAHTCVVTVEGGVKCWGLNQSGQLGDGTTSDRSTPVEVQGLPGRIIQVAAGWEYTCALTEAGQVWCWGDGMNDRFGGGSTAVYTTPVEVGGQIQEVKRLAAGQYHLCSLTTSEEVKCWGSLTSEAPYSPEKPMTIEGLSGSILDLVAGGGHT